MLKSIRHDHFILGDQSIMFLALFLACNGDKGDTALDTAATDTGPIPNPLANIDWLDENLVLTIQHGEGHDFSLGIVESTDECTLDTTYGCWTAENCGEDAWSSVNGNFVRGPYCHSAGDEGVALKYGEGVMNAINGSAFVTDGTTAFPAPTETDSYEFKVSYILTDRISQDCWAWGVEPSYFDEQNCKYPVPTQLDTPNRIHLELR